jgi:signal transduction histidine kinase
MLSRLGLRPAVLLGMALTIGIWVLAYFYFSHRIDAIEKRQTELATRYQAAQDLLAIVRTDAVAAAAAARNASIDPDAAEARDDVQRVETARQSTRGALDRYELSFRGEPALDTEAQRMQVTRLEQQTDELHRTIAAMLASGGAGRQALAPALQREMASARDASMNGAEALRVLNREGYLQEQNRVSASYKSTQRDILGTLGFALAASLGIAIVLGRYAGILENRVARQRARDIDNAINLQRLTARLVTAQEEERRHIARELHDEVGQVLTVVKMALRDAQLALGDTGLPKDASEALEEAYVVSDRALRSVRDLSRLLHPSLLDDMGLTVALDAHIEGFRRRHGIAVTSEYDNIEERLPPDIELALYRTVQEALTNVARHAHAAHVRIAVHRTDRRVNLSIEDDGTGFDAVAASQPGPRRGLGLLGMQERVHQFGGDMVIESAAGRGTKLSVSVPLTPATGADVATAHAAAASEGTRA